MGHYQGAAVLISTDVVIEDLEEDPCPKWCASGESKLFDGELGQVSI